MDEVSMAFWDNFEERSCIRFFVFFPGWCFLDFAVQEI